jgi:hypothetical protein
VKRKRIVSRVLLEEIRAMSCLVCGRMGCDPSHVTSVGAGGNDTEDNVMPLCRDCHQRWHFLGAFTFSIHHPPVLEWFFRHRRVDFLVSAYERARR